MSRLQSASHEAYDAETAGQLDLVQGLILRPGARDVAPFISFTNGHLSAMARRLVEDCRGHRRVGLITGAYMAGAPRPAAETDGPVGVAALAAALVAVGGRPIVITDDPCAVVTQACLDRLGVECDLVSLPVDSPGNAIVERVDGLGLAHLIAVERLGPNVDGKVMTMGAMDVTEHTAPLHVVVESASIPTSAIGDGGNEIGMGNVPVDVIAGSVEHGTSIACTARVDDLVVAGTSNWGCYGAIACLAILVPEHAGALQLLLQPDTDREVVEAATAAGGIDGVTGHPGESVDGVAIRNYWGLLRSLSDLAGGSH